MRIIDGQSLRAADGAPIAKPNVLVQYRQVSADRSDVDVNGNLSMYTHTIGKGRVVLFRNGKRIVGTWSLREASLSRWCAMAHWPERLRVSLPPPWSATADSEVR